MAPCDGVAWQKSAETRCFEIALRFAKREQPPHSQPLSPSTERRSLYSYAVVINFRLSIIWPRKPAAVPRDRDRIQSPGRSSRCCIDRLIIDEGPVPALIVEREPLGVMHDLQCRPDTDGYSVESKTRSQRGSRPIMNIGPAANDRGRGTATEHTLPREIVPPGAARPHRGARAAVARGASGRPVRGLPCRPRRDRGPGRAAVRFRPCCRPPARTARPARAQDADQAR